MQRILLQKGCFGDKEMKKGLLKKILRILIGLPIITAIWLMFFIIAVFFYIILAPLNWILTGSIGDAFIEWMEDFTSTSPYRFIKEIWSE